MNLPPNQLNLMEQNMMDCESPPHLQMEKSVMNSISDFENKSLDHSLTSPNESRRSSQQLEAKIEMVYSLLSMLGGQAYADVGETLLELSTNTESCLAMRQSGCLPLLVQLVQSEKDFETRKKASEALHNLVHSQSDEKVRKRESKILKLLEALSVHIEELESSTETSKDDILTDGEHPVAIMSQIMKLSFDEGHRQAICQLGGIHFMVKLIQIEHTTHGSASENKNCNLLRRYACMVLTNLTFGDSGNKALLCSYKNFIRVLVHQLQSPSDELRQVTASILRNLSWRADSTSKEILKECKSAEGLMKAAMLTNKENTLTSILSALWNLSAHCIENKESICSVKGALTFLVQMLTYKSITDSQAVIENSGGILRNISSQIALREDYRNIIRRYSCLQILTEHLKSKNLTVVSNACGALWNLSSNNTNDQEVLWKLGAPTLLRSLSTSKHKMIAIGSSATLTNLLNAKSCHIPPTLDDGEPLDLSLPSSKTRNQILPDDADQEICGLTGNSSAINEDTHLSPVLLKRSHEMKSSSFASLNVNDSSQERRSRMLQSCGSSSLPYVNSTTSGSLSCVPTRNNYSDFFEDELASSEEPFDFSRRYSETRAAVNVSKTKCSEKSTYNYEKAEDSKEKLSMYAETDLDQPTDYSLRYAEDDSDSDSDDNNVEKTAVEFVGDTIKTYCTEGTPYETPLNFSTSTSMSDLRTGDRLPADKNKILTRENDTEENRPNKIEKNCASDKSLELQKQSHCSKTKSDYSSGITSPEKPMNYCEEGTPGYFSRVSSFGSLNSSPACTGEEKSTKEMQKSEKTELNSKEHTIEQKIPVNEVKVVKFEENVNYCEETPLMFSRSSSLGSLGSIEQHSIHDDRSSVISDFSRLTSGIVSPSELPDSPTQTIPPSPNPQKIAETSGVHRKINDAKNRVSVKKLLPKSGFFEDHVKKFKEESTPTRNSITTSLSSLTIDDQDDGNDQKCLSGNGSKLDITGDKLNIDYKKTMSSEDSTDGPIFNIRRYAAHERKSDSPTSSKTDSRLVQNDRATHSKNTKAIMTFQPGILPAPLPVDNTIHTYCTEDTPAVLSHNGSISDLSLSTMSILDEEPIPNKVYMSENSSQSSEGYQNKMVNKAKPDYIHQKIQVPLWDRINYSSSSKCPMKNDDGYLLAQDEVSRFVVEDSPMEFSLRSSLSNLTFESSPVSETIESSPKKPTSPEPAPSHDCFDNCDEIKECHDVNTGTLKPGQLIEDLKEADNIQDVSSEAVRLESFKNSDDKFESSNSIIFTELDSSALNEAPIEECKCDQLATHDSLKKKKWRWKWKFNSEASERSSSRESSPCEESSPVHSIGKDICSTSRMDTLYSRSLDASYRKKKWWRWKFGSKETEYPPTAKKNDIDNVNTLTIGNESNRQIIEESKTGSEVNPNITRSDIIVDNNNKSKRWKWRWKFNFRASENPRSEDVLKFSKFKHSVSPMENRESYLIGGTKANKHNNHSLKILSRSMSEPRRNKKLEETKLYTIPRTSFEEAPSKFLDESKEGYVEAVDCNAQDSPMNATSEIRDHINEMPICSGSNITARSSSEIGSDQSGIANSSKKHPTESTNYAALVEECIQMGMPNRNKSLNDACSHSETNELVSISHSGEATERPKVNSNACIIEECIQQGMPAKENIKRTNQAVKNIAELSASDKLVAANQKDLGQNSMLKSSEGSYIISQHSTANQNYKPTAIDQCDTSSVAGNSMTNSESHARAICKEDLRFLREKFNQLCEFQEGEHTEPSEITLDPVTLAIVKKILTNRLNNESLSINEVSKDVQTRTTSNNSDCDFEIVLEERIKVSLPKNKSRERLASPVRYRTLCGLNPDSNMNERRHFSDRENLEDSKAPKTFENKDSVKISDKNLDKVSQASKTMNDLKNSTLIEECIQMGMPKKKHVTNDIIYANIPVSPGYSRSKSVLKKEDKIQKRIETVVSERDVSKEPHTEVAPTWPTYHENSTNHKQLLVDKNLPKLNEKQNYAALLEECIQMGMPKKQETHSLEIRTTSHSKVYSGVSSPVDSNSLSRGDKHNIGKQPHIMSTQVDESEEVIYANVAMTAGYSRSSTLDRPTGSLKKISQMQKTQLDENTDSKDSIDDGNNKQSYSALVEECIQMGMPLNKKTEPSAVSDKSDLKDRPSNKMKKQNYEALIEECIQLGMPKKVMASEEAIYANTTERYSTFKGYTKSDCGFNSSSLRKISRGKSEPGCSVIPFATFGRRSSELTCSASSMDDGCNQNFPKTRQTITVSRTIGSSTVSESSKVVPYNGSNESESKNVNVASVARNTPESHRGYYRAPIMATGAEDDSKILSGTMIDHQSIEERLGAPKKNGFSIQSLDDFHSNPTESLCESNQFDDSSEMSFARFGEIDSSLLDPKIILDSLVRYTKKLVSEAELRLYRNPENTAFVVDQTKYQKTH